MIRRLPQSAQDGVLLVARLMLGVVLFAYGWEKVFGKGIAATAAGFAKSGVPAPQLSALFAATVELGGGTALILGAATGLVGVLVALNMAGAALTTGQYQAVLSQNHGFALTGSIFAGALLLAVFGAGRFSLDHALPGASNKSRETAAK